MSMHIEVRELEPSAAAKPGLLRRLLALLAKVLVPPPKGDQGGWEGGARGL